MALALLASLALAGTIAAAPAQVVDGGRFGPTHVEQPQGPARGYVVVFSDHGGWGASDQAALDALANAGALAIGVDTDSYLARIAPGVRPCSELVGDVEGLSQKLQRAQDEGEYHFPILAGFGAGGALAQTIFAGAPVNTLAGAATIDPSPAPPGGLACSGAPPNVNGFWSVGLTPAASPDTRSAIEASQKAGAPIEVAAIAAGTAAEGLRALVEPRLDAANSRGLGDVPLVDLPSSHPSPLMVVLISGDGGWRDIDKRLGDQLQSDGVAVVGWDSLRYFWRRKTPERTAEDLAAVIQAYRSKWGADKVALVGYSFGADVIPAVYDRLPAHIKRHIVQVSLLGLESRADWEIRISGWFGAAPSDEATPVGPALQAMRGSLIQCFYGAEETDTDCPSLAASGAEIIRTAGSHHFGGDYEGLARRIFEGLERRAGSAGRTAAPQLIISPRKWLEIVRAIWRSLGRVRTTGARRTSR
jgi:type IV secretory pathway VirJ component